ncbi:MAG: hypothetical protein DDG58_11170 [Ardenticatenia bacterium]|nr:MAG: hypothetical protein DDG58_11170 [Ardenticatenia bacterium]
MERRHHTDGEAFYCPYLLQAQSVRQFLALNARWVYGYNGLRLHTEAGTENQPPLAVLRCLGYRGDEGIVLFPPVLLDGIAADRLLICDPEAGNELLAYYSTTRWTAISHLFLSSWA